MQHERVTLKNGLTVVNLSSYHSFKFDDGSLLEGCQEEVTNSLKLEAIEIEQPWADGRASDIELAFRMTPAVEKALSELEKDETIDVILVPLPVMTAIKNSKRPIGKARVCRVANRISKVIYSNKFCI